MPRQPDHPHVMAEVLATELRSDAEFPGEPQNLLLKFQIPERVAGGLPVVGRVSRYRALAYFAVLSASSALVPPITIARWYGGQAEVPS